MEFESDGNNDKVEIHRWFITMFALQNLTRGRGLHEGVLRLESDR